MNEPVDYPDFVVRFYDVVYHQIRSHIDEAYFLDQIAQAKGKVLEIGVGTGSHLRRLSGKSDHRSINGFYLGLQTVHVVTVSPTVFVSDI